jgi:hypothetical protein
VTEINPHHAAPCGLYCGVCRIHIATQERDLVYLRRLARIYQRRFPQMASVPPDQLLCDGCLSAKRYPFCQQCSIRECTQQKGLRGCYACVEFPCDLIAQFPMPVGRSVILRAVPYWREHGMQAWAIAERRRYQCPDCGHQLFRGARQCNRCASTVDLD